jgi:molecular chaperone DnaK
LTGKEPHKGVNPDEVVALGAAIQAGILAREVHDVLLLDVTPLSLGVETLGGVMTKMIERNTTIPTQKSEIYSTAADGQTEVEINVLQGERPMAQDNRSLGRFRLQGIPSAPRGVPKVEVAFNIDVNGILNVTARDMASGNKQEITISGSGQLERNEVDKMVKDAEAHAAEDQQRKDDIQARNQAEQLMYSSERSLKDFGDKVPTEDREEAEKGIASVKEALASDDPSRIRLAADGLNSIMAKITEAIYARATSSGADTATGGAHADEGGEKPGGDDVIDAEFRESD